MTKISINFAKNPLDVYDAVPSLGNDYHLFLQSMDNSRLCDLAVRRMPQNYRVTDARVLGMSNIILNQNGYASLENICFNPNISDKVIDKEETSFTADGKQIEFSSNAVTSIDNAVFIGGHWNFGHWLFNHIGRFCFISEELRKDTTFLVPTSLTEKQIEMLKYFGVESSNMLLIKPGALVNVGELLVPQMPWHSISEFGTWWSPGVFKELREKLGLHTASVTNATRKILLSRRSTRWRRLVNEDEIYNSLEKFGFEMIDAEEIGIHGGSIRVYIYGGLRKWTGEFHTRFIPMKQKCVSYQRFIPAFHTI